MIKDITIEETPEAARIASEIVAEMKAEMNRRAMVHQRVRNKLWKSDEAPPEAIVAALGTSAVDIFAAAEANIRNLAELAPRFGEGASINDYLQPEQYLSPPEYTKTPQPDGSIVLTKKG